MSPSDIAHSNNGMINDGWNSGIVDVIGFVVSVMPESGMSSESGEEPE
jgi:hypothetical protein